jgi:hypothetical protein
MQVKQKKVKSQWMKGFILTKPLDDLAKAQLETRLKTLNDFKKIKWR